MDLFDTMLEYVRLWNALPTKVTLKQLGLEMYCVWGTCKRHDTEEWCLTTRPNERFICLACCDHWISPTRSTEWIGP